MSRPLRPTVNLTEEEAASLQAHPDYRGSLGGLLRTLACRQLGLPEPDPYADHKSRARDEKGRIVKTYRIEFQGFEPAAADTRGYHDADFLKGEIPANGFASEAEAREWLAANDRGPDSEGVRATWAIE